MFNVRIPSIFNKRTGKQTYMSMWQCMNVMEYGQMLRLQHRKGEMMGMIGKCLLATGNTERVQQQANKRKQNEGKN